MQIRLFLKLIIIGVLALVMFIPLALVHNQVSDRQQRQGEAIRRVSESTAEAQRLIGPLLVVPYKTYEQRKAADFEKTKKMETVEENHVAMIFADRLDTQANLATDFKTSGIYQVPVFTMTSNQQAKFKVDRRIPAAAVISQPYLAYSVTDPRGLRGEPKLRLNGEPVMLQSGSLLTSSPSGFHGPLVGAAAKEILNAIKQGDSVAGSSESLKLDVALDLEVIGTQSVSFVPSGYDNQVALTSSWPSPSFFGRFSPERTPNESGFKATWRVSKLATSALDTLRAGTVAATPGATEPKGRYGTPISASNIDEFGLNLYTSASIYQQAERAVKYGILFIVVTFAAVFLFENIKGLPVHPIQYAFVGMSLAIFFLLLISLSEHMSFAQAYLVSAAACIGLITIYLQAILRSWKSTLMFTTKLAVLYGVLFGILRREDDALLMGSILLFSLLAGAMLITRKLDWYSLGATPKKPINTEPQPAN